MKVVVADEGEISQAKIDISNKIVLYHLLVPLDLVQTIQKTLTQRVPIIIM